MGLCVNSACFDWISQYYSELIVTKPILIEWQEVKNKWGSKIEDSSDVAYSDPIAVQL